MEEVLKLALKYWRAILIVVMVFGLDNAMSGYWDTASWKTPDKVTVYEDYYGNEISRSTSYGTWQTDFIHPDPWVINVCWIFILSLCWMYYKESPKKKMGWTFVAFLIFLFFSGADGDMFSGVLIFGLLVLTKKRQTVDSTPT